MRTDLMIKMIPNEKGELHILNPFIIYVLFFADDGFLFAIKYKRFDVEFKAAELTEYVNECESWPEVSEEKKKELKAIYFKKDKIDC